jgi:exodeoxyribonuclease-5/deoxyribonuclease V
MILAFDSYYFDNKAKTVCVAFEDWCSDKPYKIYDETIEHTEDYQSGEFYKRELPCIISLLNKIDIQSIDIIIVDGFVFLDDDGKLGLGGYLYQTLQQKIPVIGVAKNNFATIVHCKQALLRGESMKPLYITAIGVDVQEATQKIKSMHGEFRIPTLLKMLDGHTKEKL